jgi:hypothetical protein
MQNRSHTKHVTSKLTNSSFEAAYQRSQLMFVLSCCISQQFFAPSHQLGPKYHLVLVDHTLWWTKIIIICIRMLQSRKTSCSPREKSNTTQTILSFYKRLTPNCAKINGTVRHIKITHMVTPDTFIPYNNNNKKAKNFPY